MLLKERCWFLLQIKDISKVNDYFTKLTKHSIAKENIILIIRDKESLDDTSKTILLKEQGAVLIFNEKNEDFELSLDDLKTFLFRKHGMGIKAQYPNSYDKNSHFKNYFQIEKMLKEETKNDFKILFHKPDFTNSSCDVTKSLNNYSFDQLKSDLFPQLNSISLIEEKEKQKNDSKKSGHKVLNYDKEIEKIQQKKIELPIPQVIVLFDEKLRQNEFEIIKEIYRAQSFYQHPKIQENLAKKNDLVSKFKKKKDELDKNSNNTINTVELEKLKDEIKEINQKIDSKSFGSELFMRELFTMYSDEEFRKKHHLNYDQFIESTAELIINGDGIEIIDSDYSHFNQQIFKDIFTELDKKIKNQFGFKEEILVVSIIGPQSTGKSTLLNKLFGTNFKMSAGRCTKGLYASFKN